MLRSMTGFGRAEDVCDGVHLAIELRSVNNRYFRPTLKMPEFLAGVGSEIESSLRNRIGRGAVTVSVRVKLPPDQLNRLNVDALSTYVEQLRSLEIDSDPLLRIDLGSLLQLPGVLQSEHEADLAGKLTAPLLKVLAAAAEKLTEMRDQEGLALATELAEYCQLISKHLDEVQKYAPKVIQQYHERLTVRVNDLMRSSGASIEPEVLAREVAIFAERADIAKEISRLRGHIEQFEKTVASSTEPCGRKLDFLAQEMLREANTIASKANDAEIVQSSVEIKTAVDRIKEQVQNVE